MQTKPEGADASSGNDSEPAVADKSDTIPTIDIGGVLPTLTLKNEKGEDVEVSSLAAEKGVVIFLIPKADTRESLPPFRKKVAD